MLLGSSILFSFNSVMKQKQKKIRTHMAMVAPDAPRKHRPSRMLADDYKAIPFELDIKEVTLIFFVFFSYFF